jgi:hypothetical protein
MALFEANPSSLSPLADLFIYSTKSPIIRVNTYARLPIGWVRMKSPCHSSFGTSSAKSKRYTFGVVLLKFCSKTKLFRSRISYFEPLATLRGQKILSSVLVMARFVLRTCRCGLTVCRLLLRQFFQGS